MKNLRQKIVNYSSALVLADMPMKNFRRKVVNYALAIVYPLWPPRLPELPGLLWMFLRHWSSASNTRASFAPVETALRKPNGLLAIGGDLNTACLVKAYREGIYPHSHIGPIKWHAPQDRMVQFPKEAHISKTLRQLLKKKNIA